MYPDFILKVNPPLVPPLVHEQRTAKVLLPVSRDSSRDRVRKVKEVLFSPQTLRDIRHGYSRLSPGMSSPSERRRNGCVSMKTELMSLSPEGHESRIQVRVRHLS
jgi:hypothetical protein